MKGVLLREGLSCYVYHVVDKKAIYVHDMETDTMVKFEPEQEKYYVLSMSFHDTWGLVVLRELLWFEMKRVSEAEFKSELYCNLPFVEGPYVFCK
ncbi:MAG: hypothetical protein K2Q45_05415 [Nitrosomonas sp.]|nr:hypothetical protein [Nitrosomonas sp.]